MRRRYPGPDGTRCGISWAMATPVLTVFTANGALTVLQLFLYQVYAARRTKEKERTVIPIICICRYLYKLYVI